MATEIRFQATPSSGEVSALLESPANARCLYVLAHGAGAGMRHPFLEAMAARLAEREVATLRYQFPYMEKGARRPGPAAVAEKTVRSAVAKATELSDLPVIAGGKSYGGRMTAYALAKQRVPEVLGLAFLGFPLHAPGRDGTERWSPMSSVGLPMLFLQGSRDRLANRDLLRPLLPALEPPATLHEIVDGDHSFKVPKRTGRSADEVLDELAATLAQWATNLAQKR